MKKRTMLALAVALLTTSNLMAHEADSLKVIDIEEVLVIATPKENRKLRELPTASTLLSQQDMQAAQVRSIKNLTALVPNIFIPDYGSRLTSSIYIRGIGSRINTPAVGMYVDNIPYIDKSAFDFNYSDIERIDVLRGPQGTLYGRNAMGGLIKVHTKSPFSYQGTDLKLGAGTRNAYNASLTHYHRTSNQLAFSVGAFYDYSGGFFRNDALDGKKVDHSQSAGGRIRAIYMPANNWKLDLNLNYEHSNQGGYPYHYTGRVNDNEDQDPRADKINRISYNQESGYRRNLLNTGLNTEYQASNFTLSFVTGFQHLKDRMFLDQDFTEADIYTIEQKQRISTLSEEIVMKSKPGKRWQWSTGIFGFYQWLKTEGPVDFKEQGIKTMIENNVNKVFANLGPKAPAMTMTANNKTLQVGGNFDTPVWSGAIYHQSTVNDLLIEGLSLTAGLRLDYEKMSMRYRSMSDPLDFDFNLTMQMPGMPMPIKLSDKNLKAPAGMEGEFSNDYLQLLPKFALQYEWAKGNSVYASASRGYRSGGYNIQMFSDIATVLQRNAMVDALKTSPVFSKYASMISSMMPAEKVDVQATTTYRPEYSWNYEVGAHLTLWQGRIWADVAAFYMDTRDQQVSRFAPSGLGRETVNAGKSRSLGAEAALRASLTDALSMNLSYGYTHATFTDYVTNERQNGKLADVNYNGHFVPFVPRHTLSLGGQYIFRINPGHWLDQVQLNANYTGAGRIYWTEQNNVSQSFYGTLNGRVSFQKGPGQIDLWVRNALDNNYTAFYFESMGNGFAQRSRPIQAGIEVRCRF